MPGTVAFREVHTLLKSHGWSLEQIRDDQALYIKKGVAELIVEFPEGQVSSRDYETIKAIIEQEEEGPGFGFGPR